MPILQIINLIFGLLLFAWEWPLGLIAGTGFHRSLELRLVVLPLSALSAALLYQGTNPAIYTVVGMVVYFWAYSEGEVCRTSICREDDRQEADSPYQIICAKPWTLPQRGRPSGPGKG